MKKDELEDFHKRDDVGEWNVFLSKIAIFCGENDLLIKISEGQVRIYFINNDCIVFLLEFRMYSTLVFSFKA